jgi:uncharacterized glyoxalase superfamily protein PhnB
VAIAARWLCEAFGFQEVDRAQELDGNVRYVSLRLGDSIALLRPVANSLLDDFMVQPEAVGGANTQMCYVTVPDVSDHHARAERAGARVGLEPQDDGLGGRFYTCRDLEDHLWCFGTHAYAGVHGAASAFEPVVVSPSTPDSPQQGAREPTKRGRLRGIAIAAATALLLTAGWAYYDTYVRNTLSEAEARAVATSARLKDTEDQLAHERSLRLAAEAASTDAAAKLAAELTVIGQLRQAVARANAEKNEAARELEAAHELNKKHRLERDRAEAKVAAANVQIAGTEAKLAQLASGEALAQERFAKEQQASLKVKEELEKATAALLAANKRIEELQAGQLEPMVPDDGEPVAENSTCVLAVQGKIAASHKGPNTWTTANLNRLCRGAEGSLEPGRCFEEIMRGAVNWGAGTKWVTSNALALCGGAPNARRTLDCFKRQVSSGQTWQVAIRQCRGK